jgi:lysozyme family protein
MAKLDFDSVKQEYENLFATMVVKDSGMTEADAIVTKIANHKSVYESVMNVTGVPWQFVGIFHSMEASLDFGAHLHNGDPLTARTVQVPKGRPKTGNPPFTFAESAIDALQFDGLSGLTSWELAETLFRLEKYNGVGYRSRGINTPYLWSYSNHYAKGKFVADGHFDTNAVSKQCGAAVILKRMIDREVFAFAGMPRELGVVVDGTLQPSIFAFVQKGNSWIAPRLLSAFIPGLSVAAVSNNPLRITVQYLTSNNVNNAKTRSFSGEMFHGNGHVDASDLIGEFLGMKLSFDGSTTPGRLVITTK